MAGTDNPQESSLQDTRRTAVFSTDDDYRYRLGRLWNADKPIVAFVMLNPSTADATTDDPTIRRCLNYAEDWGYGTLLVGNLFALRSTDPSRLHDHPEPVGPDNDEHLREICETAERVIAAWGVHGLIQERGREITRKLSSEFYALDTTKEGHPNHPLYQPKDAEPKPFRYV